MNQATGSNSRSQHWMMHRANISVGVLRESNQVEMSEVEPSDERVWNGLSVRANPSLMGFTNNKSKCSATGTPFPAAQQSLD
jgi:hypothetical protein